MLTYPAADRDDVFDHLHGIAVHDPYRWLEDVGDPRTQAWSDEQRALTDTRAQGWSGRAHFRRRLAALLAGGGVSAPIWRGQQRFFLRRDGDQQHPVLITADATGRERVLIDPMQLDSEGLTTLDAWQVSPDGRLIAYQVSFGGSEESVLHVAQVSDMSLVEPTIDRARYSPIAWLADSSAFYFVRRLHPALVPADEAQFHRRVYLHRIGTDADRDD
ncbi:MAG: prolyl oligopeptidase family serine peptidase, partial [Candidatus Nanopelagicales bacterium]